MAAIAFLSSIPISAHGQDMYWADIWYWWWDGAKEEDLQHNKDSELNCKRGWTSYSDFYLC